MPSTQFQTINCDSRNTLIRNRDDIKSKFGVTMRFPKNLVRGGFQDMVLEGGAQAIFAAQKEINRILVLWQEEYDAFLERKAKRALFERRGRHFRKAQQLEEWPEVVDTSSTAEPNRKTHKNKFAGLRLDEGEVVPVENFPTLGATGHIDGSMIPAMETKSVLSGWSKVAAKPAAKPAAKSTSAHVSAFVENDRFEWGAESEVEDEPETTNMVDWPTLTTREPYNFGNPGVHIEWGIHGEDYSEYANFNSDDEDEITGTHQRRLVRIM